MTPAQPHPDTLPPAAVGGTGHAGAMLREAREAAGLSIDAVSQQLKLAPRQVKALEDGDFALLPGRTFVRGFARNYARLVHLDPDAIVEALTGAPTEGGLESPPLHSTAITMGELPSNGNGRPGWLRWALTGAILVLIAAGIAYQYFRGNLGGASNGSGTPALSTTTAPAKSDATDVPNPPLPPAPAAGGAVSGTPLAPSVTPLSTESTPAGAPAGAPANASPPVPAADAGSIAPLSLTLRGGSWVEIKDSTGRVVLSETMPAGQTQVVLGAPPLDVVIGNAREVTLTFRGRPVDLAPFTRQNVARLALQ